MCPFFFAVVCLFSGPKTSAEVVPIPSDWPAEVRSVVEEYAVRAETIRGDQIAQAEADLAQAKKIRPRSISDRQIKESRIEELTDRLKRLRAGVILPIVEMEVTLAKKGQFGRLVHRNSWVEGEAIQILERSVLVNVKRFRDSAGEIIIQGLDTENLIDGSEVPLSMPLRCIGPQSFTAVSGASRTLMAFEVIPIADKLEEWENLRNKAYAEANAKPTKK